MRNKVTTAPYPLRVIDTKSLKFKDDLRCYGHRGGYAILSHTWISLDQGGEVLYRQAMDLFEKYNETTASLLEVLSKGKELPDTIKPGYLKLLNAINVAKQMGYQYIWVDSCCIDKVSKIEEGISIPSMGDWYANADVCFIFLDDVALSKEDIRIAVTQSPLMPLSAESPSPPRWATRGWTLQEIIASPRTIFFNKHWKEIFSIDLTERYPSIGESRLLYKLCQVPASFVYDDVRRFVRLRQKGRLTILLSLAANRHTTISEDRAYCLMKLLGVYIQPIPNEGFGKAFDRLCDRFQEVTGVKIGDWVARFHQQNDVLNPLYNYGTSQKYAYSEQLLSVSIVQKVEYGHSKSELHAIRLRCIKSIAEKPAFDATCAPLVCELFFDSGEQLQLIIRCRPLHWRYYHVDGKTQWALVKASNGSFGWRLAELSREERVGLEWKYFGKGIDTFGITQSFVETLTSKSKLMNLHAMWEEDVSNDKEEEWIRLQEQLRESQEFEQTFRKLVKSLSSGEKAVFY